MGSARMGNDPATSVAGPYGELHDAPGRVDRRRQRVPDGVRDEPDADQMALALRTAEAIAAV